MPVDQVVFSLIAAASAADARLLNERAALPVDRIAGAVALLRAEAAPMSGTSERREEP